MNYTPIQTTTYGGLDGGKPRWEARTQLGYVYYRSLKAISWPDYLDRWCKFQYEKNLTRSK
jgi:hypothetical protein